MPNNESKPGMTPTTAPASGGQPKSTTMGTTDKSPENPKANPAAIPGRVETKRDTDNSVNMKKPNSKRTDDVKGEQKPL